MARGVQSDNAGICNRTIGMGRISIRPTRRLWLRDRWLVVGSEFGSVVDVSQNTTVSRGYWRNR